MAPFKFTNDGDGLQLLLSKLKILALEDDSLIIGLESTAHYSDKLVRIIWKMLTGKLEFNLN